MKIKVGEWYKVKWGNRVCMVEVYKLSRYTTYCTFIHFRRNWFCKDFVGDATFSNMIAEGLNLPLCILTPAKKVLREMVI